MTDPPPIEPEDILYALDPAHDNAGWGAAQRQQLAWHLGKCADFSEVCMRIWELHGRGGRFEDVRRMRDLFGHALRVLSRFRVPTRQDLGGGP